MGTPTGERGRGLQGSGSSEVTYHRRVPEKLLIRRIPLRLVNPFRGRDKQVSRVDVTVVSGRCTLLVSTDDLSVWVPVPVRATLSFRFTRRRKTTRNREEGDGDKGVSGPCLRSVSLHLSVRGRSLRRPRQTYPKRDGEGFTYGVIKRQRRT